MNWDNLEEVKESLWLYLLQYWPFILLTLVIVTTIQKHGMDGVLYQILKQLLCVSLMCVVAIFGYVIIMKHIKEFEKQITLSTISQFMTGKYAKLMENGDLMIPFSNLLFSSGILTFILGLLYTKLPIDLIPDIIPFIGLYDNYLATMIAFIGMFVCVIGICLSTIYYEKEPEKIEEEANIVTKYMYASFSFIYDVANKTFG